MFKHFLCRFEVSDSFPDMLIRIRCLKICGCNELGASVANFFISIKININFYAKYKVVLTYIYFKFSFLKSIYKDSKCPQRCFCNTQCCYKLSFRFRMAVNCPLNILSSPPVSPQLNSPAIS